MTRRHQARAARIERIIEYRRRLTEQAQQRLAEESRAASAAEEALARLRQSRRELAEDLERLVSTPVDPAVLEAGELYQRWLAHRAREQESLLDVARQREEQARELLVAQQREQRKLEKVQEHWQAESNREARRHEDLQLDEAALSRYCLERHPEGAGR